MGHWGHVPPPPQESTHLGLLKIMPKMRQNTSLLRKKNSGSAHSPLPRPFSYGYTPFSIPYPLSASTTTRSWLQEATTFPSLAKRLSVLMLCCVTAVALFGRCFVRAHDCTSVQRQRCITCDYTALETRRLAGRSYPYYCRWRLRQQQRCTADFRLRRRVASCFFSPPSLQHLRCLVWYVTENS